MAGNSTTYDVRVKYALEDKASKGAGSIASACDKASTSAFSLRGALAAAGGAMLIGKAKGALIDFNNEIDKMKIGMSTIMQMQLHLPISQANKEADKLFATFQEIAKKSPATTKDFMKMASFIAPAVALAGGGPDKLAKMTQGAVITSLALGEDAEMVGRDIQQMLAGTVGLKDRTALQLLGGAGIDKEKFNAMSAPDRAKKTEELLSQDSLKNAADKMGESFAGQTSTFTDQLQIALGKVGLPLMQAITSEVKKWNTWIEKHPRLIGQYVNSFAGMIKSAFSFVKSVAGFLVDNRETLFTIGKIFLAFKGAQIAQGAIGGLVKGLSGLADTVKKSSGLIGEGIFGSGGIGSSIGKLSTGLLGALPAIGAFTAGLFAAASWVADNMPNTLNKGEKKAMGTVDTMAETLHEATQTITRIKEIEKQGALLPKGMNEEQKTEVENLRAKFSDPNFMAPILKGIDEQSGGQLRSKTPTEFFEKGLGISNEDMDSHGTFAAQKFLGTDALGTNMDKAHIKTLYEVDQTLTAIQSMMGVFERNDIFEAAFNDKYKPKMPDSTWKPTTDAKVEVNIQRVEVASEDPDRFVFGLVKIGEQASKHATSSQHATPGGF